MALVVVVNISNADQVALENDLLDLEDWVQKAVTGKIDSAKKRFVTEWLPKLEADPDVTDIPVDRDALIAMVRARPDYADRTARDARQAAEEAARRAAPPVLAP
jgi:hypothetical protein